MRHLPTRLLGIVYKFVYTIQRHIQPRIENLEYETHGNFIFSIFLRVDSLKKKFFPSNIFGDFVRYIPAEAPPQKYGDIVSDWQQRLVVEN